MNIKDIHKSITIRTVIIGLCALIVLLGVFELGVKVGDHKARFSEHFGDNYQRNFVDSRNGFFNDVLERRPPPGGHGAAGQVVSVALPLVVVAGPDKLEKTVVVGDQTLIREFRDDAKQGDLKVGDFVVVLGNPNDKGQIEAKLIRIIPTPETSSVASSTQSK